MTVFILAGFCLFPPFLLAVCVVCLTGDVYGDRRRTGGSLSRWSRLNKAVAVLLMPAQVVVIASRTGGSAEPAIMIAGLGAWLAAAAGVFRALRPRAGIREGGRGAAAVSHPGAAGDENVWIVADDGERGPYEAGTLCRMLIDGFVTPDTPVRRRSGECRLAEIVPVDPASVPGARVGGRRVSRPVKWAAVLLVAGAGAAAVVLSQSGRPGNPAGLIAPASPARPGAPKPAEVSAEPTVLAVDTARFAASRHGAWVYYADGLREEAERLGRFLWKHGRFSGEAGGRQAWLGRAGGGLVLGMPPDSGGLTPDWRDNARMAVCAMAARCCPGRALEWAACDRDWKVIDRVAAAASHEVSILPDVRLFAERDRGPGERVARRIRELGLFAGADGERTVALLREPGRRILCVSTPDELFAYREAAAMSSLRDELQPETSGEEFVIRCLPETGKGRRDFTGGKISPGTP